MREEKKRIEKENEEAREKDRLMKEINHKHFKDIVTTNDVCQDRLKDQENEI